MKKNTKKKVFTLMLVIMLLSIAIVGGSLAWFTAEDQVTNTFTVGSIKIQQNEWDQYGSPFQQDQVMMPVVNMNNPSADQNYIHKVVTVSNTGDNPAYVRTFIAVDNRIAQYVCLDLNLQSDGWYRDAEHDGVSGDYKVLAFTCSKELNKGETTATLLKGVYLDARVDVQVNPESNNREFCVWDDATKEYHFTKYAVEDAEHTTYPVKVLVATQAVQSQGFNSAAEALDAAFENRLPDFAG